MLKECFIKATNYKALEDVTDVDNEVKEFLENKSVLLPPVAFVVSTNEFGVGDKMGQGPLQCTEWNLQFFVMALHKVLQLYKGYLYLFQNHAVLQKILGTKICATKKFYLLFVQSRLLLA